ncbi:hypothetical protein NC653_024131 [Populus alba x Populus x berolinensis]|uniref:Uncharacterized protein n=1 Tax=Populus alba x Populus x berolinensis TaxID=444605 RepID=A0AAD6M823_9ROSI|nr:hypothetical protein NC653_024131 [Populus alba x Populus x berolinensis]
MPVKLPGAVGVFGAAYDTVQRSRAIRASYRNSSAGRLQDLSKSQHVFVLGFIPSERTYLQAHLQGVPGWKEVKN